MKEYFLHRGSMYRIDDFSLVTRNEDVIEKALENGECSYRHRVLKMTSVDYEMVFDLMIENAELKDEIKQLNQEIPIPPEGY